MSDPMCFDLVRSDYFNERAKLLKDNEAPKLSQARANLGDSLADVVCRQCERALKKDFGLDEPLKGPGDTLWMSPSDLLQGKVALKPPFTSKCLQALTHKGILEIGEQLEMKFREEMEQDKQRALEKYKAELLATIEDRMRAEIKDVEIRERLNCRLEMEKQQQEFEVVLKEELDKLERIIGKQYQEYMASQERTLKARWEAKLQEEVRKTVEAMTKDFLVQLDQQEKKLTDVFELELKKLEVLRAFDAKQNKQKISEALRHMKHNLECTNLVNMLYVLCAERRKCCEEKEKLESFYQNIIRYLEGQISKRNEDVKRVTRDKEQQLREVALREACLREILKHFQKFINFALRAAPTQAEFLLSVEKMMVFELTNAVAKTEVPEPKKRRMPDLLPWRFDSKSDKLSEMSNLEIQDYHKCLNELNPPTPENQSELGEADALPAMYFKDRLYVREDFRDMLSGGVEITSSNELWSKDVEILVDKWRKDLLSVDQTTSMLKAEKMSKERVQNVENLGFDACTSEDRVTERRRSKQSTVQFIQSTRNSGSTRRSVESNKRASRKSSLKPLPLDLPLPEEVDVQVSNSVLILAARDSLEVLIEQRQKSEKDLLHQEAEDEQLESTDLGSYSPQSEIIEEPKELVIETRDSILLRIASYGKEQPFAVSPTDSLELTRSRSITDSKAPLEVKNRSSKLTSARNSVEMLRVSLMKLREPSVICQKKDRSINHEQGTMFSFSGTCCERCKQRKSLTDSPVDSNHKHDSNIIKSDSLSDEKSVKISHIEVISLEDKNMAAQSVVSFQTEPIVYTAESTTSDSQATSRVGKKKQRTTRPAPKKVLKKTARGPTYKLSVVGDKEAKEGDESMDEFTSERIHSLINVMKDHPYLMQMFTAGSR